MGSRSFASQVKDVLVPLAALFEEQGKPNQSAKTLSRIPFDGVSM